MFTVIYNAIAFGLAWLVGKLVVLGPSIFAHILVFFGISYATSSLIDFGVQNYIDELSGYMNGIPADVIQILGIMGFDIALSLIFASYAVFIQIKITMAYGRWVTKAPSGNFSA
jgi:hypothetical protein